MRAGIRRQCSVGGRPAGEVIVNGKAAEGGWQVQSTYKRPLTILRSLWGCVRNRISIKLWFWMKAYSGATSPMSPPSPLPHSSDHVRNVRRHPGSEFTLVVSSESVFSSLRRTAPSLPTLHRFIYGGDDGFRTTMERKAATRDREGNALEGQCRVLG